LVRTNHLLPVHITDGTAPKFNRKRVESEVGTPNLKEFVKRLIRDQFSALPRHRKMIFQYWAVKKKDL